MAIYPPTGRIDPSIEELGMRTTTLFLVLIIFELAPGCGGSSKSNVTENVNASSSGGATFGGSAARGGASAGGTSSGEATSNAGVSAVGGTTSDGSLGGLASLGGLSSIGGVSTQGTRPTGGVASIGGKSGTGGALATGGSRVVDSTGGTRASGGASVASTGGNATASGGSATTAGSVATNSCDPGSTTTTWATNCPTAPPNTCTAGTWIAGGPQNDSCCSAMTKCSESDHFVVYSDETCSAAATTAVQHLETVWNLYFGSPFYMREPFCNSATKYKANVHVHSDWGLTGGAFNGRMGMWIGTSGLSDHWGLAHEFMHGVQSVAGGQACSSSNTCGWVYESHANWAAQQQAEYHTSNVHCSEMLANMPHLYLGSTRDRYCNWQFLEYLKDKYCFSAVNALWTGTAAADPFTAIRNHLGWSVGQLNDFIGEWAMHNITWDYQDPSPQSTAGKNQGALYRTNYGITTNTSQNVRRLRITKLEPLDANTTTHRRFISPYTWAPQRYGYNVVRLVPDANATEVTVTFRGVTSAPASPDWRWGLVATDSGVTMARYSLLQKGSDGALTFCVKSGELLFLVVTATPSAWYNIVWDQAYNTVPRYPYALELAGAWPEGFQNGAPDVCPTGTVRVGNGGGCGPSSLASTVYVGPYALVTGSGVTGSARIEGHAQILGGKVSDGTVGSLTILGSAFTLSGASTQAMTTFYPLDNFEGRSLTGGALIGDVELRSNRSGGSCSGFVDATTCTGPGTDGTPAPPYAWR